MGKDDISASLRNELRRLSSLKILAYLYTKPSMKKGEQEELMKNCFHGNREKGIASHLMMLVRGEGEYADLYDRTINVVTDPHAPASSVNSLVLKPELHRSDKTIIAGRHISEQTLQKTSFKSTAPLISGRNLLSAGNEALRTVKKAISIAKPLLNEDGSPKDSGTTHADIIRTVLDEMYATLSGRRSIDDEAEDDANDEAADEAEDGRQRPNDWFFNGWFAFLLFGPMAPPNKRLDLFLTGNPANDGNHKSSGRSAFRQRDAEDKEKERSQGGSSDRGGLTMRDRISLANLDLQKLAQAQSKKEAKIIALKLQSEMLSRQIERAEKRGDQEKVESLEEQETSLYEEMARLSAPSPQSNEKKGSMLDELLLFAGPAKKPRLSITKANPSPPTSTVSVPFSPPFDASTSSQLTGGTEMVGDSAENTGSIQNGTEPL
jgi:hypothetical protein